jgi:hypothetical protein
LYKKLSKIENCTFRKNIDTSIEFNQIIELDDESNSDENND